MKFEDNWHRGLRRGRLKVDGRWTTTDGWTDDGQQVIIIAHPEPPAQVS